MANKLLLRNLRVGGQPGISQFPSDFSSGLQLDDNDKGFLPNRLTTAQRNAIENPGTGLLIYNLDNSELEIWNGSAWVSVGSGGGGAISSGKITSPVAYVQFSMPDTYNFFELALVGVQVSNSNVLNFQFSQDGGTTWLTGYNMGLTYGTTYSGNPYNLSFTDTYGALGLHTPFPDYSGMVRMTIYPGSDTVYPMALTTAYGPEGSSPEIWWYENGVSSLTTLGLVNAVRIGPWFSDSETLTNGSYAIWGY